MPCYTVKKTSVNVSVMNLGQLKLGLEAAGYKVDKKGATLFFSMPGSYLVHEYGDGALSIAGDEVEGLVNEVKRAYSAQIIRSSMVRAGWKLNEKKTEKGVSFQATKRG